MFINSLILAISSSIDSLGIGITYGIKNTRISYMAKVVLLSISFIISIISIWFGTVLKNILSISFTKYIGGFILIFMGVFMFFQAIKKDKNKEKFNNLLSSDKLNKNTIQYVNKEKIYSFFIRFLGITIQIIKNPSSSDFDKSNSIDAKEALFLGLALSLDSFCIGVSLSMLDINSVIFPFAISLFQLLFMSFGNYLGCKLNKISHLPDNIWSISSGILLSIIGFCKLIG
mgnify:CR=1 FL=1